MCGSTAARLADAVPPEIHHPRWPTATHRGEAALEKRPVIDKSRGSQLSIVGYVDHFLCNQCDVGEIRREWRHIRPGENPAG